MTQWYFKEYLGEYFKEFLLNTLRPNLDYFKKTLSLHTNFRATSRPL